MLRSAEVLPLFRRFVGDRADGASRPEVLPTPRDVARKVSLYTQEDKRSSDGRKTRPSHAVTGGRTLTGVRSAQGYGFGFRITLFSREVWCGSVVVVVL